jgi:hypothetical protein
MLQPPPYPQSSTPPYEFGVGIAQDFAKHLRPQARQMPMFAPDDYVTYAEHWLWRGDVFVDDDYIFGAHIVVGCAPRPGEAKNGLLQSLFIHRYPNRSTNRDRDYIVHWLGNATLFRMAGAEWYHMARREFMNWYAYVNLNREQVRKDIDAGHHSHHLRPYERDEWGWNDAVLHSKPGMSPRALDQLRREWMALPITQNSRKITDITNS